MVHQVGNIVIYNVYLLPETKSWVGDLESDPCLALAPSLAVAYAGAFHILIMGELNARTGSQTPSVHDPVRHSLDEKPPSTRGRFLFKLCTDYNLMSINGVERFGPNSGEFTSF
jgi:energy-converting hydrogenase Eha subunit E